MSSDYTEEGAAAGALIALVLGNAGVQAVIPEEILTIPAAMSIGALVGSLIKKKK